MKLKSLRAFLRKSMQQNLFRKSIRPTDTFLVTYPKSGTTWLGFLLANIIVGDANDHLNLRTFHNIVPDVNHLYSQGASLGEYSSLPDPRIFLVHASFDSSFPRVVYVVRDPRDVMVSYWHHHKLTVPGFNQTLNEFIQSSDTLRPSSWEAHVSGWLLEHRSPKIMLVKYEDMLSDTVAVVRKVVDFSKIKCSDADILKAVDASRFDEMRALEERFGVDNAVNTAEERFIRKGKSKGWEDELNSECLELLEQKCAEVMRQVGYKPVTIS